jgi:hypothetical protein
MNTLNKISTKIALMTIITLALGGCVATMKEQVLDTNNESQLQKRSYQTRAFDTEGGCRYKVQLYLISRVGKMNQAPHIFRTPS